MEITYIESMIKCDCGLDLYFEQGKMKKTCSCGKVFEMKVEFATS